LAQHWPNRSGRFIHLPRFDCNKNQIGWADLFRIVGRTDPHLKVSFDTLNPQRTASKRLQGISASEKNDIISPQSQSPAEVPANCACSDDRHFHNLRKHVFGGPGVKII
jgi:hypothetical protein